MKIRERLASFLLVVLVAFSFVPSIKVNAAVISDINIISDTKVTVEQAKKWAKSKGATETFINLAELYFKYAKTCGNVNPGVAYVQAAKETGYGKFGGVLDESYHNPCGLKTSSGGGDKDPNAHQRFNSWDEGVQAHLDHLALYAGAAGYPKSNTYDPRHFVTIKGNAPTVNSLGGKWAPSSTYGEEINTLYRNLLDSAGVTIGSEEIKDGNGSDTSTPSNPNNSGNVVVTPPEDTVAPQAPPVNNPIEIKVDKTTNISSSIGWKSEGGYWYYYRSNGSKATGWIKPDENWYYMYSNGAMATGWLQLGSTWYYLNPVSDGTAGAMKYGWQKIDGKWYYFQGDGSMVKGFNSINGKTYFLDASGAMRINWFKISDQWYYFDNSGAMVTGWIKPDGNWYYLFSNGIMATGMTAINGKWYHLQSSGVMSTGWVQNNGDYYYFDPVSGAMVSNTVIDGWEIGPDGKRGNKVSGGNSKLIVVDAGHNFGGDDGAYATHNGIQYSERDLNMQIALKLKSKLEAYGYQVVMTREESDRETASVSESLSKRVNLANNLNADLFVSLHHNSAGSSSANGVETYYSDRAQDSSFGGAYDSKKISTSKNLASKINNAIVSKTGQYNRGAKEASLYVCRNTKMPSVLIELGFISNPNEAVKCASSSNQDLAATAIAEAIAAAL
ncbi:MAG: N-acetylmuramoyl-L-alanine amidase [Clostridium sp.]